MKKIYCYAVVLILLSTGCGVSKQVHQAALDEVKSKTTQIEGLKQELEKTREEIDRLKKELEKVTTAKDDEISSLKKELEILSKKADETSKEIERPKREEAASSGGEKVRDEDYVKLTQKVEELSKEKDFLAREFERFKKYADEEQEINKKIDAAYDTISKELGSEIGKGVIGASKGRGRLSISFSLFDSGDASVNKRGALVLNKIGRVLKNLSKMEVRVEGHTDSAGIGPKIRNRYPSNWELSTARATNIVKYLREKAGIDPKLLSASGLAKYRPVSDNKTEKQRGKNRRVEIVLIPLQ